MIRLASFRFSYIDIPFIFDKPKIKEMLAYIDESVYHIAWESLYPELFEGFKCGQTKKFKQMVFVYTI